VSIVICSAAEAIRYMQNVYRSFTLFYTDLSRFREKSVQEVYIKFCFVKIGIVGAIPFLGSK